MVKAVHLFACCLSILAHLPSPDADLGHDPDQQARALLIEQ